MRRNDTNIIGGLGEAEAKKLLIDRGYTCRNLNDKKRNAWTYDLEVDVLGDTINISVKAARAKRDISLGRPRSLKRLSNDAFMMIQMPSSKTQEIRFEPGGYHLLIVPGQVVVDEALSSHYHYWGNDSQKAENNTVRIKDKVDRPGGRSNSGAVFSSWNDKYRDAWHLLPGPQVQSSF